MIELLFWRKIQMKITKTALLKDRVFSAVEKYPGLTAIEVATETRDDIDQVLSALHGMKKDGILVMNKVVDNDPLSTQLNKRVYSVSPTSTYVYSTAISR
jgi:hypothetical protein